MMDGDFFNLNDNKFR